MVDRGRLAEADLRKALSVVSEKPPSSGRRSRCRNCGLLFPKEEVHPEFDEDGRRTGWICSGCE